MKVAFSSTLGGLVGFLIAYALSPHWLAGTVGLAAGGILGYVFVDARSFLSSCASAWKELTKAREPIDFGKRLELLFWSQVASFSMTSTVFTLMWLFGAVVNAFVTHKTTEVFFIEGAQIFVIGGSSIGVLFGLMIFTMGRGWTRNSLDPAITDAKECARHTNPVAAAYYIAKYAPGAAMRFARFVVKFVSLVVRKTLSNERICGLLGAASGAGVGFYYFEDQLAVGTAASALIGLVVGYGLSLAGNRVRARS